MASTGEAQSPEQRSAQSGDIQLEDTSKKTKDAPERGRDELNAWFSSLEKSFRSGIVREPVQLGDAGVTYLAMFYFYCTTRIGSCPFILDTILESDVIRSQNEKENSCPTMTRFWKAWLAGDFDSRAKYEISAAVAEKMDQFNSTERPRYIKCKDAVADILEDRSNLESRYGESGVASANLNRTRSLLQELWAKGIDVFVGQSRAEDDAAE